MKKSLLIFCGAWLYLTSAKASGLLEEKRPLLSSRAIINMFVDMSLTEQNDFCKNLITAGCFVTKKFNSYGLNEEDFPEYTRRNNTFSFNYYNYGSIEWGTKTGLYASDSKLSAFEKTQIILEMLNLYPKELKEVESYALYKKRDVPLFLKTYLKFCIDINPGLESCGPAVLDTHQVLIGLGIDQAVETENKKISELTWKIARPFREPFGVRPLNICGIRRDLQELKKHIQTGQISYACRFRPPFL